MLGHSIWPLDGSRLDLFDKWCSAPLFQLQLGLILETVLSFPGCWFGMPLFCAPAALGHAIMASGASTSRLAWTVLALELGLLASAWLAVLFTPGGLRIARLLYSPATVALAPAATVWLLRQLDLPGAAAGYSFLLYWFAAVTPVLALKKLTTRRRPIVCDVRHIGMLCTAAASAKRLRAVSQIVKHDPSASFPSGDVAGAVSFACVLWRCSDRPLIGLACALLSATGRMYWQAHHLLDVTTGAALGLLMCATCDAIIGEPCAARWWHPFVGQFIVITMVLAMRVTLAPAPVGRPDRDAKGKGG